MDTFSSFFDERTRTTWNTNALKNFQALSPKVQNHLQKVFTTLCASLLLSAVGVYVHILSHVGGVLTHIGFIGAGKRMKLLVAAAFLQGCSIGNLVEAVLSFDPSIVLSAFLGTVAIFACFAGAALLAKRREMLFIGGVASSAISIMFALRFATLFVGGSAAMFQLELYGGLLIFVGYVLFDTQMIVERADRGDLDYVKHSLDLFIDFVAIFVRILIILTKNAEKRERDDKRKTNTRRR
eukprot:jgi/Mesen1/7932/ME000422S07091